MSRIDDGGAAFPNSVQPDFQDAEAGMSLRDWFAGQALAGIISSAEEHFQGNAQDRDALEAWKDDVDRRWAEYCYRMADAMLAARNTIALVDEANARLIAAAPDLLAMLKHAVHWHDQLSAKDIARYEAVIAAAEGK